MTKKLGATPKPETKTISIASIKPQMLTRSISQKAIEEMAKSIAEVGLLQPIGVVQDGTLYELLYGATRLAAMKYNGATHIEALVYPEGLPADDRLLITLTENLKRTNLDRVAEGESYLEIMQRTGWNSAELARRLNTTINAIIRCTDLTLLEDSVKQMVRDRVLGFSMGASIARIDDKAVHKSFAERAIKTPLTRDELDREVKDYLRGKRKKNPKQHKVNTAHVKAIINGDLVVVSEELTAILKIVKKCINENLPPSVINSLLAN